VITAARLGPWHLPEKYQIAQAVGWPPHLADRVPAPIVLEMVSIAQSTGWACGTQWRAKLAIFHLSC
jgi:hypothetical protein